VERNYCLFLQPWRSRHYSEVLVTTEHSTEIWWSLNSLYFSIIACLSIFTYDVKCKHKSITRLASCHVKRNKWETICKRALGWRWRQLLSYAPKSSKLRPLIPKQYVGGLWHYIPSVPFGSYIKVAFHTKSTQPQGNFIYCVFLSTKNHKFFSTFFLIQ
jgi:hypothetical protein